MAVCRSPAHHLGVRAIQDIFTINEDRLFHWVRDRRVPADNNYAERNLRPTVIARSDIAGGYPSYLTKWTKVPKKPKEYLTEFQKMTIMEICYTT
jgi:hypothetical protein